MPVACSVSGCHGSVLARGMCGKHYARLRRTGGTDAIRPTYDDGRDLREHLVEKFLRGIRKLDSGCWICDEAQPAGNGYAAVKIGGAKTGIARESVHRLSYEHFKGPIVDDLHVLHECDNRPCCNPDHLFLGTSADNQQDMADKDRSCHGVKHWRVKLSEKDVLAIYAQGSRGIPQKEIAEQFGVTVSNVSFILSGKSWSRLYKRHMASAHV